jgi:hypothetical protein
MDCLAPLEMTVAGEQYIPNDTFDVIVRLDRTTQDSRDGSAL